VFVAVPEQHKSGRSLLAWALRHVAAVDGAAVVVAHVHAPAQMIPMSTCSRSASSLLARHRTLTVGPGSRAEECGTLTLAFPCIARLAFWFIYLPEPQMLRRSRRRRRRRGQNRGPVAHAGEHIWISMCRCRGFHLSDRFVLRSSNAVTLVTQRPRRWDFRICIRLSAWPIGW
jgi:hypothetical protein